MSRKVNLEGLFVKVDLPVEPKSISRPKMWSVHKMGTNRWEQRQIGFKDSLSALMLTNKSRGCRPLCSFLSPLRASGCVSAAMGAV